jgi:predicted ATP-dependent endonuclease of OLD family
VYLRRVVIKNCRAIRSATVAFKIGLTISVGDNEAEKYTVLEAIQLAITGRLGGRHVKNPAVSAPVQHRHVPRIRRVAHPRAHATNGSSARVSRSTATDPIPARETFLSGSVRPHSP